MSKKLTSNEMHDYLKKLHERVEQNYFNLNQTEDFKVVIRPDESISRAKFKKHPLIDNGYLAHPDTIRALRQDIFFHGGFEDLENIIECHQCAKHYDLQFWKLCPYCCATPKT